MGSGTWKNFELILLFRGGEGGGSQFPDLGVPQGKDMKHVNAVVLFTKTSHVAYPSTVLVETNSCVLTRVTFLIRLCWNSCICFNLYVSSYVFTPSSGGYLFSPSVVFRLPQ